VVAAGFLAAALAPDVFSADVVALLAGARLPLA
jgi:hypothetical protein